MSRGRKGNDNADEPATRAYVDAQSMHTDEQLADLERRIESLEESRRVHNSRIAGLERVTRIRKR